MRGTVSGVRATLIVREDAPGTICRKRVFYDLESGGREAAAREVEVSQSREILFGP